MEKAQDLINLTEKNISKVANEVKKILKTSPLLKKTLNEEITEDQERLVKQAINDTEKSSKHLSKYIKELPEWAREQLEPHLESGKISIKDADFCVGQGPDGINIAYLTIIKGGTYEQAESFVNAAKQDPSLNDVLCDDLRDNGLTPDDIMAKYGDEIFDANESCEIWGSLEDGKNYNICDNVEFEEYDFDAAFVNENILANIDLDKKIESIANISNNAKGMDTAIETMAEAGVAVIGDVGEIAL